jgi:hypothetical protein
MRRAGITITHVTEHAIKSAGDYRAVAHIFANARVEANYEGYRAFQREVGERGLAVAFSGVAGSPMHFLQRELMAMDLFMYELYDHPDELAECAQAIGQYFESVFEVVSRCPAEVVMFGANYDATVTYPPFYQEHIGPWLKKFAKLLHSREKYLLTHTDGENSGLLDHYLESGFDIADSICPAPMTKLSFKEVRDHFNGRITIMGGIPSVCLLRETMPGNDFERFLDAFFHDLGQGDHLILGISDTTPPGADFERIKAIGERVKRFGPIRK